ncbi:MAG: hypothetical protein LC745_06765, partial [Planctomycetia bacterium]|nr:hypothetical protein [Planctomycetia bacterium]
GVNRTVFITLPRQLHGSNRQGIPAPSPSAIVGSTGPARLYQLGRTLTVDPMNERFVGEGAEGANLLLSRPYRAPFVVPETL